MVANDPYENHSAPNDHPGHKGTAGSVVMWSTLTVGVVAIVATCFLPFVRVDGQATHRTHCRINLRQIALGLHNYHDVYDTFPPAYTVDDNGQPLHSWRTLILPYLDRAELYKSVDLSKPWDDPANAAVSEQTPWVYRCLTADIPDGCTTYLGVAAPGGIFEKGRQTKLSEIVDGPENTLMVIEVEHDQAVPWMAPRDDQGLFLLLLNEEMAMSHSDGAQGVMADGSLYVLPADADRQTVKPLISIRGRLDKGGRAFE